MYAHDFTGKPVNNIILDQFDAQRNRGTQGFGVFDAVHDHLVKEKTENGILKWLCKEKNNSNILLFHHRFPTSTINVPKAAHPFSTMKYFGKTEYILVHNGVMANENSRKTAHNALGITYQSQLDDGTFNDSEALLWDFALFMEGKQKEMESKGRIAFICMKLRSGKLDKLYFARNSSPLNLLREKDGIMLSSEGEGEPIDPQTLYTWNYQLKRLTKRPLDLPQFVPYVSNYGTCGYQPNGYQGGYQPSGDYWDDDDYQGYPVRELPGLDTLDSTGKWKQYAQRLLGVGNEEEDEDVISYALDDDEVEGRKLEYLFRHQGSFNQAYWDCENDYYAALDEAEINGDYYEVDLLEVVMREIEKDPENVEENSVSSAMEAIYG